MDHIPLPIYNPVRINVSVPVVCTESFTYDDWGFLTYPSRVGVSADELCERDAAWQPSALPFIQAWLWFGLLGETLGIGVKTDRPQKINNFEQFTKLQPDGSRSLSTFRLDEAVRGRRKAVALSFAQKSLLQRYDSCLLMASESISQILGTPTARRTIEKSSCLEDLGTEGLVFLAIQILVDTLKSRRATIFAAPSLSSICNGPKLRFESRLLDLLLREAGRAAFQAQHPHAEVQVQYFMSSTRPSCSDSASRGTLCSDPGVSTIISDETQLLPSHTRAGCRCEMVEVADETVDALSERGLAPLVTYDIQSAYKPEISLCGVALDGGGTPMPYVAFSHVRSQGFGHGDRHGLYHCQLTLLQDVANDVLGAGPNHSVPFYIDTICLPLLPDSKSRAIKSLATIFERAAVTAVLDPSLRLVDVGGNIDALLRIRFSNWKARLWTLQEGSVTRRLVFIFANTYLDLDAAVKAVEAKAPFSILAGTVSPTPLNEGISSVLSRIRAFDADLKLLCEKDDALVAEDKYNLRSLLRRGYLALPRYHFLCDHVERAASRRVLHALEEVYQEGMACDHDGLGQARERMCRVGALATSTSSEAASRTG